VLTKHAQYFLHRTTFLGAGIQLTVGIGPCPTLAKGVVALGVYDVFAGDTGKVALAFVDVFATLNNYRPQAKFYQAQGCKQTARTGSYDDNCRTAFDRRIVHRLELCFADRFVKPQAQAEVHKHLPLAGIYTATHYPKALYPARPHSTFFCCTLSKKGISGCHLGHYT
jgi:hypothetical protein